MVWLNFNFNVTFRNINWNLKYWVPYHRSCAFRSNYLHWLQSLEFASLQLRRRLALAWILWHQGVGLVCSSLVWICRNLVLTGKDVALHVLVDFYLPSTWPRVRHRLVLWLGLPLFQVSICCDLVRRIWWWLLDRLLTQTACYFSGCAFLVVPFGTRWSIVAIAYLCISRDICAVILRRDNVRSVKHHGVWR